MKETAWLVSSVRREVDVVVSRASGETVPWLVSTIPWDAPADELGARIFRPFLYSAPLPDVIVEYVYLGEDEVSFPQRIVVLKLSALSRALS